MNAVALTTTATDERPEDSETFAVARRATIESIVAHRNRALTFYGQAHTAIAAASAAVAKAQDEARHASPGINALNYHADDEKHAFIFGIKVPDRKPWLATARRLIDIDVWSYVVQITDLERLMDKKAKEELRQQLMKDPPEATVENIVATLDKFLLDAGTIWKRGIAECFSNLDRRFRSHDGWKVGARIILTHALDTRWSGGWDLNRNHEATILDIERVFKILDKGMRAKLGYGIIHQIDNSRRGGSGPRQSMFEDEYFRIRCFKNGNIHIWFKRDDLVEEVNKLLGQYYGAPIPEDRDPDEDTGLYDPKLTPAKRYGFFPTPDAAAETVIENARLVAFSDDRDSLRSLSVLEPSAGTGNLARRCTKATYEHWDNRSSQQRTKRVTHKVDCVEIQPALADALSAEGIYRKVYPVDFLALSPTTTGPYDRIVMNPPFDRERDIDHVIHALEFLKPDGVLTAVMSAGTEFRSTKKSLAFREIMRSMHATFSDLPAGSFASVGTYCNTIVVTVRKGATATRWGYGGGERSFAEVE